MKGEGEKRGSLQEKYTAAKENSGKKKEGKEGPGYGTPSAIP